MKILGVIPARGGSKGVKRKNIRLVAGKPLIAYSIEAAKHARLLTRFIVSTEDAEIAAVAKNLGAEVIARPKEIAEDTTPMVDVIKHAFHCLEDREETFDAGLILQPTAPLRTAEDIDLAIEMFGKSNARSLVSVYQVSDCHPARMYRIEEGVLIPLHEEPKQRLRQALPPIFHRNGAIYLFHKSLLAEGSLMGDRPIPFVMSRESSINIDEEIDLDLADLLLRKRMM